MDPVITGRWMAEFEHFNLSEHQKSQGDREALWEVWLFLYAIKATGQSLPDTRRVSLPYEHDLVWHNLIVDQLLYDSILGRLEQLAGPGRPWHALKRVVSDEEFEERLAAWTKLRRGSFGVRSPVTLGRSSQSAQAPASRLDDDYVGPGPRATAPAQASQGDSSRTEGGRA